MLVTTCGLEISEALDTAKSTRLSLFVILHFGILGCYSKHFIIRVKFYYCSFQELAIYDLHSQFSFVAKTTGFKIRYIGQSLGTTTAIIYSILRAEESVEFVEIMIHVTPVAYWKDLKSSLALLSRFAPILIVPKCLKLLLKPLV